MLKLGMVFPYTPLNLKTYTLGTSSSTKGYLHCNTNIERTLAKILVCALERQVSGGDTKNEIVDH
jgi:hypothetical protein